MDALMHVAESGRTAHPMIQAVWLARLINTQSGGTVVAPWQVDELPEEWVSVFSELASELPTMKQARAKVKKLFEDHRKNHPTYRKVVH